MDSVRFDRLAKQFAGGSSRRSFLKGIAKTAIAAVGIGGPAGTVLWPRSGDAASCRDGAVSCTGDSQYCSGSCAEPDTRGRRHCTCAEPQSACGLKCCDAGDECVEGVCQTPQPVAGCGQGGDCLVFVTEHRVTGSFGGIAVGDAICQVEADASYLPSGTYAVWLSDQSSSPANRFKQSTGPYKLTTGDLVANNWTDLTDGNIANPIVYKANGAIITNTGSIYTGTEPDGFRSDGGFDCLEWDSDSTLEYGTAGFAGNTSPQWTNYTKFACSSPLRLYCFQQSGSQT